MGVGAPELPLGHSTPAGERVGPHVFPLNLVSSSFKSPSRVRLFATPWPGLPVHRHLLGVCSNACPCPWLRGAALVPALWRSAAALHAWLRLWPPPPLPAEPHKSGLALCVSPLWPRGPFRSLKIPGLRLLVDRTKETSYLLGRDGLQGFYTSV